MLELNQSSGTATEKAIRDLFDHLSLHGCMLESVHVQNDVWVMVIDISRDLTPVGQDIQARVRAAFSLRWPHISVRIVLTQKTVPPSLPVDRVPARLEGAHYVIAVGSGKGGVGKSTTALNIACGLMTLGWRVGILDGDIYGPSIHKMLKTDQKVRSDGKKMAPIMIHGLKVMSMGFLVAEDKPVVWRGPMVHHALRQMIFDVSWTDLDCLVIDLPPGTGDAHLTLTQKVHLDGAVIVSTPQEIALIDARKAIAMFRIMNTPILGLIENMSLFHCPQCHYEMPVFHTEGAHHEAIRQKIPFLGAVPLDPLIGQKSEQGVPIVLSEPAHTVSQKYLQMSHLIQKSLTFKN